MKPQSTDNTQNQEQQDPSRQLFSSSFANQNTHQVPEITLPKGGGALKGIDEKFQVNPVNGTNSVSIPLPVSPARAGFSPSLSIQYSSGQGNGLFGLGWGVGIPSIRRKTDKQLPKYQDSTESDIYTLAGAEDLIPKLKKNGSNWEPLERTTATHLIKQYQPRIEGSWLRIERWTELGTGIIHWRTISTGNIITVYGDTKASRIEDPSLDTGAAIFEWKISYSYDNKGNIICYEYKAEDFENVATSVYEKNRFFETQTGRSSKTVINRYLKRVFYGNRTHYTHGDALPTSSSFLFETLLDYGEHNVVLPSPVEENDWEARPDAFSSFRSGFDIRTYRLCKRVLLFHKFDVQTDQPIVDLLVSALELKYESFPEENVSNPNLEGFTYLKEALSKGYEYDTANNVYKEAEMPPMSFYYQEHAWNTEIETLEETSLENSPTGINNNGYSWTDFYGEGISGILSEQNQAWYYKENLGDGAFSPAKLLQEKPSFNGLNAGAVQFQDLEGTGERQLVSWNTPQGFFNFKDGETWEGFQYFEKTLNRNISNDPNARFIDLDGDGRPDLLITEDDLFQWYNSEGKKGFGTVNTLFKAVNEEEGPRIVFADREQSIFLADMTGDGMTDIVRIKNQEVCYWANKGYGHFSAKVIMGNAPHFDHPELFNPKYLKLTDIDGSGTTDLVYLRKDSIQVWMNHSGNIWSIAPQIINPFPAIDNQVNVDLVDLLGTGTACIVWSSMAAKDVGTPLRYMNLTNSKKPHLLYQYKNNTGAAVEIEYISSTHFYLEDKKAGKPWATKLPFPVHVVHKTTATDYIRNTVFVSKYSYHHGYYDQVEREFRGFGRVEQLDTEDFNILQATGASNIHSDPAHFQVPIKTVSWFHTGASFKHQLLTDAYQAEYYSNTDVEQALNGVVLPEGLNDQAYHEAFRACKGLPLRQEIYSLDFDNDQQVHPYSASESSYEVRQVQGHEGQRYASFITVPVQSMSYGYERNPADPRISQDIVLKTDDLGIPTDTVSIIYPRLITGVVPWMVEVEQAKIHGVYKQISLNLDVDEDDAYRLRGAYEEKMYELLGLSWTSLSPYYDKESIHDFLEKIIDEPVRELRFDQDYDTVLGGEQMRLSGHGKAQFLKDDLSGVLPFGVQEALGIPGKSYQLTYTPDLLTKLYQTSVGTDLLLSAGLNLPATSGYVDLDGDENWWVPSGKTVYPPGAATNFYLPSGMKDAFGNLTKVYFDNYQYLPTGTADALGNTTSTIYDYRVLSPKLMTDPNGNRAAVAFDTLGIVVKSAVMGKVGSGDGDTLENPTAEMKYQFFNWKDNKEPNYIHSRVKEEHYGVTNVKNEDEGAWQESYEYSDGGGGVILAKMKTKDGLVGANASVTKRWIGNGRTVIDNKGNPIKQYEPYFSETHEYEPEAILVGIGVSPILYYDAAGRNIRTELPNDTFVKVEFDAWKTVEYDTNDTVKDSKWYTDLYDANPLNLPIPPNMAILDSIGEPIGALVTPELRAAWFASQHANTPNITHTDCLGRAIYTETKESDKITAATHAAFTQTDLAGRFSQIYDQIATDQLFANGTGDYNITRNVSSYGLTNLLGQGVYSKTAVKGESWVFTDILGRMLRVWDNPDSVNLRDQKIFRTEYDVLHRPLKTFVQRGANAEICVAKTTYGESLPSAFPLTWNSGQVLAANLRGQAYQSFDQSGVMTTVKIDFKGNPLSMQRQLVDNYTTRIDWNISQTMEADIFETSSTYDALNRPKLTILPDQTILKPTYNKGGYLKELSAQIMGRGSEIDFLKGQDYDAKGQRKYVKYGNNVITKFFYDVKTFRLSQLLTTDSSNNDLQDLNYTYDPVGNIMRVKDGAQNTFYHQNQVIAPLKEYEYDALYRLKKASGREHSGANAPTNQDLAHLVNVPNSTIASAVRGYTQKYEYDKAGNILQVKHQAGASGSWTRDYNYTINDANNRLISTKIGGNTYLYNSYDGHGNMTEMNHLRALHWDYQDQLTEVELNGTGDRAYYNYDGSGQRVRKVVVKNGRRTERLYLGGVERYREYSASSVNSPNGTVEQERWTVQIDDIAQVDTLTVDNSVAVTIPIPLIRYQYRDHLGSAAMETNESGQVISYEEYHPFGTSAYRTAKSGTDLSLKRYRFTNKERDDETGLHYFGVRYYAAWLGRWTSSDPGDFVDGLNMYVYVRNNPVNGVDELGYNTDSVHKDADGNVIAVYDDNDDGIYMHKDLALSNGIHKDGLKGVINEKRDQFGTSGGGERVGTYTPGTDTNYGWNTNVSVSSELSGPSYNTSLDGPSIPLWDYLSLYPLKTADKGWGEIENNIFVIQAASTRDRFNELKALYTVDPGKVHNPGNFWGAYAPIENPYDNDNTLAKGDFMAINIAGPYNGVVKLTDVTVTDTSFRIEASILNGGSFFPTFNTGDAHGMININHPDAGNIIFEASYDFVTETVTYRIENNTSIGNILTYTATYIPLVNPPRAFQAANWVSVLDNVENIITEPTWRIIQKNHTKTKASGVTETRILPSRTSW
jgi:RHS repeat-associated protein